MDEKDADEPSWRTGPSARSKEYPPRPSQTATISPVNSTRHVAVSRVSPPKALTLAGRLARPRLWPRTRPRRVRACAATVYRVTAWTKTEAEGDVELRPCFYAGEAAHGSAPSDGW